MATKSKVAGTSKQRWVEVDDWGTPTWFSSKNDGAFTPFEWLLRSGELDSAAIKSRAVELDGDLTVATSLARSHFGPAWRDHVWPIMDRLQKPSKR